MNDVQWAHHLAAEAVEEMPAGERCPADSSVEARKCPDCISRAAVNAVTAWLGSEGRLEAAVPYVI